jgi:hypothetical protein
LAYRAFLSAFLFSLFSLCRIVFSLSLSPVQHLTRIATSSGVTFFLLFLLVTLSLSNHSHGERMLGNRTMKRFQVLGSMDDETYIELLDSGLRNDNNSGTTFNFSVFRSYSMHFKISYNHY